jgi:hypothetical protein
VVVPACACLPDPASRGLSTARMHRSAGHRVCGSTVGGNGPSPRGLKQARNGGGVRSPTKRDGSSLTQLEIKTQKQKQHTDVSQGGQSSRLAGPPTPGAGQRDRGADVSLRVQRPATAEPHACHTALCRRLARLRDGACGIVVSAVPARPRSGRPAHACKAGGGTGGQRWRVGAEIFVAPPSTGGRGSLIR